MFTLETFHLMQANAAFTDCDAKACYDRMVAIVIGLALHKVGLPILMSSFLIKALKQMRYYMNTAYEISTETNQHSNTSPVHGSGQGATNTPPGWGFTSHICLVQYDKNHMDAKCATQRNQSHKYEMQTCL
eukprot:10410475-Ditylum_brightwellii.AAC.1